MENAKCDFKEFDLVSDRNNLRKLLKWVSTSGSSDDFRIDVECRGEKTMLFTRFEVKDFENIIEFRGYGHQYEKAATKAAKGLEDATGHYRIISMVRAHLPLASARNTSLIHRRPWEGTRKSKSSSEI